MQCSCSVGVLTLEVKELIKTATVTRRPLTLFPAFSSSEAALKKGICRLTPTTEDSCQCCHLFRDEKK